MSHWVSRSTPSPHDPNAALHTPHWLDAAASAFGLCEPSPPGAVRPQVGAGRPMVSRPRWGREARGGDTARAGVRSRGCPRGGVPGATVSITTRRLHEVRFKTRGSDLPTERDFDEPSWDAMLPIQLRVAAAKHEHTQTTTLESTERSTPQRLAGLFPIPHRPFARDTTLTLAAPAAVPSRERLRGQFQRPQQHPCRAAHSGDAPCVAATTTTTATTAHAAARGSRLTSAAALVCGYLHRPPP